MDTNTNNSALLEFLNDFNDFDAYFKNNDEQIDHEWVQKFFGRNDPGTIKRNLQAHLDDKFLKSCQKHGPIFEKFNIQSSNILDQVNDRYICQNCHRSRRYFCYQCYTISPLLQDKLPIVDLPIKVDIIKHAKEVDGKSTSPHAAVLAPKDVRIFTYPRMPNDWPEDLDQIFLIFPKEGSPTIEEYIKSYYLKKVMRNFEDDIDVYYQRESMGPRKALNCRKNIPFPIKRVVFIDSTWRQTKAILHDDRLEKLPALVINSEETMFWRYHKRRPVYYLSTIEAIYYFMVQMHMTIVELGNGEQCPDRRNNMDMFDDWNRWLPYEGQYDNLLFFFKHTYYLIKNRYHL